jgi:glycosyltransferase involved in cell wall biosynthesis
VNGVIDRVWGDFKFDLVHAHTAYLDGTAGLAVSKKYKVPFVITEHTGPFSNLTQNPLIKKLTLTSIQEADRVFSVSDSLSQEIKSYFSDTAIHSKIHSLYNGVNISDFFISQSKVKSEKVRFTYVGYLEEVKDPINLIYAFQIVRKEVPNAILTIVGDGSLLGEVKRLITELGLEQTCHLLGLRSREEVAKIMREETDVFVLPSKAETFGVVLIEALASGIPVVATKCGGPESIVKHSFLGELCEKENSQLLAAAMLKVSRNLSHYKQEEIREFVLNNFSYKIIVSKLDNSYQTL